MPCGFFGKRENVASFQFLQYVWDGPRITSSRETYHCLAPDLSIRFG